MKAWLYAAGAFIVSCFTFWKLGQRDGAKNEQLDSAKKRVACVSRASSIRSNADINKLRKKYKRK